MIDKVNIISHHVYNGKMRAWSSYLKYSKGSRYIEIGNQLPLPTGKELNLLNIDLADVDVSIRSMLRKIYQKLLNTKNNPDLDKKLDLYMNVLMSNSLFNKLSRSISEEQVQLTDLTDEQKELWGRLKLILRTFNNEVNIDALPNYYTLKDIINEANNIIKTAQSDINPMFLSNLLDKIRLNKDKFYRFIDSEDILLDLNELLWKYSDTITISNELIGADLIIKNLFNHHNLYFTNWSETKQREAYENFISKNIWLISIDPRNWILGQISVDTSTGPWKVFANNTLQANESSRFVGASMLGVIKQLTLTLEGKKNVGIVANSLKIFEAISHYVYKTLLTGSEEDIKNLIYDLQIHLKDLKIIANAWVNNNKFKELDSNIQEILKNVDQYIDAFIELSSLLSLAVDNAKGPTLSKINGSLNMIGLYTAGVIIGLSKEDLIKIINSRTGLMVSKLMEGNIFYDRPKLKNFSEVMTYISTGPSIDFSVFGNSANEMKAEYEKQKDNFDISKTIAAYAELENHDTYILNKLYQYNSHLTTIKYDSYIAVSKEGTEYYRPYWYDLTKLMRVNMELKEVLHGTKLNQGFKNSIEDLMSAVYGFSQIISHAERNAPYVDEDNEKKLSRSIARKQFHDANDMLGFGNTSKVSFIDFVKNTEVSSGVFYLDVVIAYYDTLKTIVNPFRVFLGVSHYRGYIEGLYTVLESSKKVSKIYDAASTVYLDIYKDLNISTSEEKATFKLIENYFHIKRNQLFFEYLGNKFTFNINNGTIIIKGVTLNTEYNRRKFKEMVEQQILPKLKQALPNNAFVLSLNLNTFSQTSDKNEDFLIKSTISTRIDNPITEALYRLAKLGLLELLSYHINGTSAVNILFAYNLIACNNLNIPGSLSPFFEDLRLSNSSSFITEYDKFIMNPIDINGKPIESLYDYKDDYEKLLMYCAPIKSKYVKDSKSKYIRCLDKNTKQYILYEINSKDPQTDDILSVEYDPDDAILIYPRGYHEVVDIQATKSLELANLSFILNDETYIIKENEGKYLVMKGNSENSELSKIINSLPYDDFSIDSLIKTLTDQNECK